MSTQEKTAMEKGIEDRMHGFTAAIKICKERAAKGDKACAAYVKGYETCAASVGE